MSGSELYLGLKKAVGEIEENGVSGFGLSNAWLYGLGKVEASGVAAEFRKEFEGIRAAYKGLDPSAEEIDDSLAANSMLMLDDEELEKLAERIRGLFGEVPHD